MIPIPNNEQRRTLANIGQIYSKIPKNTPKIPQNAPKTSKTNVNWRKKQRKKLYIDKDEDEDKHDLMIQNEQTNEDEATYVTPKQNKDEDKYDPMIHNERTDEEEAT